MKSQIHENQKNNIQRLSKALFSTVAILALVISVQAQNTNVTQTSKTTVTTVKDSDGEKKQVKQQTATETQDIQFKDTKGDPLNKEMVATPVQVTSTTQITNPDGSTRTVNTDRSSYYESNGTKYKVALDPYGYTISTDNKNMKPALLRRTSTNSYIYRTKDKTAIGYFDTNGNLVVETYDDKSDKVNIETYNRVK
ncbi:MAG TPA: hypothetical protein VK476_07210 [Flavobacterium sp.]|nr:hypothetical protein [Flavobacterium sp.]